MSGLSSSGVPPYVKIAQTKAHFFFLLGENHVNRDTLLMRMWDLNHSGSFND